ALEADRVAPAVHQLADAVAVGVGDVGGEVALVQPDAAAVDRQRQEQASRRLGGGLGALGLDDRIVVLPNVPALVQRDVVIGVDRRILDLGKALREGLDQAELDPQELGAGGVFLAAGVLGQGGDRLGRLLLLGLLDDLVPLLVQHLVDGPQGVLGAAG